MDATGYDKRDADDGGCDPKGCKPEHTRDGSRKANSRWSCEGDGCCITYSFEEPQDIVKMKIAFHKGDERTRKLDVYETYDDGKNKSQIKSSGKTLGYETFYLNTDETEKMKLCLDGDDDEWLSITEVRWASQTLFVLGCCQSYYTRSFIIYSAQHSEFIFTNIYMTEKK